MLLLNYSYYTHKTLNSPFTATVVSKQTNSPTQNSLR